MIPTYGKLFTSAHGAHDSGVWLETLKDLTPKALESGMARLRSLSGDSRFSQYPPNCLQFKDLCLAFYESLKLPSATEAYREIKNHQYGRGRYWSHAVVKFTAARLPADFLKNDNEFETYGLFKEAYEKVCHLVKQGHDIPHLHEIKTPAMYTAKKPASREIANMYLSQMKNKLGMQSCAK